MKLLLKSVYLMVCFQLVFFPAHGSVISGVRDPNLPDSQIDQASLDNLFDLSMKMIKTEVTEPSTATEISKLGNKLEQAELGNTYPSEFTDTFLLGNQEVIDIISEQSYSLSESAGRDQLPYFGPNFKTDTALVVDQKTGEFRLDFAPGGKLKASHVFRKRNVLAVYEDPYHNSMGNKDGGYLFALERSGDLYMIPKAIVSLSAFKISVPWIKVAKLNEAVMEIVERNPEAIEMTGMTWGTEAFSDYLREGVFPLTENNELQAWRAGDILVRQRISAGESIALSLYSRQTMQSHLGVGLSYLGASLDIALGNANILRGQLPGLEASPKETTKSFGIEPVLAEVTRPFIEGALAESYNAGFLSKSPAGRGLILDKEWRQNAAVLETNAKFSGLKLSDPQARKELQENWQDYIFKKEAKKPTFYERYKLGIISLSALTVMGSVDYAFYLHQIDKGPAWFLETVGFIHGSLGDVIRDHDYRWINIKSMLYLSAFVPVLYGIAKKVGKRSNAEAVPTILKYSLNYVWAYIMYPFFKGVAKLGRQDKLLDAIHVGVNPFKMIRTDSKIGEKLGINQRVSVGTNSFFARKSKERFKAEQKLQNDIIGEYSRVDKERQSLAYILAAVVAAKNVGFELSSEALEEMVRTNKLVIPAELLVGASYQGKLKELKSGELKVALEEKTKIYRSVRFLQIWKNLSVDLYFDLFEDKTERVSGFSKTMTQNELLGILENTEAIYQKNKEQPIAREAIRKAKLIKMVIVREKIGNGEEGSPYQKFRNVVPDKHLAEEVWAGFKSDFLFSAVQMGVIGARADMANPLYLGADPTGFGWTYRPHNTDMLEQIAIHMMPAAADQIAAFGEKELVRFVIAALTTKAYEPIENISLKGAQPEQTFMRSVVDWSKNVVNLRQARYPDVFLAVHKNKLFTWRANVTLGMGTLLAAGLAPEAALGTYVYFAVWGLFGFAWLWKVANYGNITTKRQLDAKNTLFDRLKVDISEGLRSGNRNQVLDAYDEMETLYRESKPKARSQDQKIVKSLVSDIAQKLGVSKSAAREVELALRDYYGLNARLILAIKNKDEAALREVSSVIRRALENAGKKIPFDLQVSETQGLAQAERLLAYSLHNPPLPKKMNSSLHQTILYSCAFITTLWATYIFSEGLDYEKNSWALAWEGIKNTAYVYASIFSGQKLIDTYAKWRDQKAADKIKRQLGQDSLAKQKEMARLRNQLRHAKRIPKAVAVERLTTAQGADSKDSPPISGHVCKSAFKRGA